MKRWEKADNSAWAALQEDAEGRLQARSAQQETKKRKRQQAPGGVARGLIRYVALVVDASEAAKEPDPRPSRLKTACDALATFCGDLLAANPLGACCVVAARDGGAKVASDPSSARRSHADALTALSKAQPKGPLSLAVALSRALDALSSAPEHALREIVVVASNLATRDAAPGLDPVADRLLHYGCRLHVAHLAAEPYVVRRLAERSGGTFSVALDRGHLDRILAERIPPPPLTAKDAAKFAERQPLVEMGFPTLRKDPAPQCAAAAVSLDRPPVWAATTYTCPRCETRVAAIPTECPVCDLPLVSAPHLARSHHHLFPVPMFVEKSGEGECFGCRAALSSEAYACPRCSSAFCADCDEFVHTVLHNCPGCCAPSGGGS